MIRWLFILCFFSILAHSALTGSVGGDGHDGNSPERVGDGVFGVEQKSLLFDGDFGGAIGDLRLFYRDQRIVGLPRPRRHQLIHFDIRR